MLFFFFFCKMEKEIQHLESEIYMKMSHRQALHQSVFTCWLSEKTTFIQPSVPALGKPLSSPLWNHVHVKSFKDMERTLRPWRPSGKESACQCRRRRFDPWVGKIPWRRKWQPTPVFLPGESLAQRSLAGYSPWGRKESDMTEWLNNGNEVLGGRGSLGRLLSKSRAAWYPN